MASIKDTQKALKESGSMKNPDKWYSVSLYGLKDETRDAIKSDLKKGWTMDKSLRSFLNTATGKPVTHDDLARNFKGLTLDGKPVNGKKTSERYKSRSLLRNARKKRMKE